MNYSAMPSVLQLTENETKSFSAQEIPGDIGEKLFRRYGNKIRIEPPSFRTNDCWEITTEGWVGFIPVSPEYGFFIQPKVPLRNLFGMWEYAYRLESFHLFDDLYQAQFLIDFYSQVAKILASRVLDRARKGYYRAYLPKEERLAYLCGRIDLLQRMRMFWDPRLDCSYEEHTADIEDNQILAWTLFVIARSGLCSPEVSYLVRKAYHSLQSVARLEPFEGKDCLKRNYSRLNQDYHPLHALCRFFLDHSGPQHEAGQHEMLPFLVNMAGLFELFVAEWLQKHLPEGYTVKAQERIDFDPSGSFYSRIDLVLYNTETMQALSVLDTKYKAPEQPSNDDVYQLYTYAGIKKCAEAVLIFPTEVRQSSDIFIGDKVHIRALTFSLDGDLEEAGKKFVAELLQGKPIT